MIEAETQCPMCQQEVNLSHVRKMEEAEASEWLHGATKKEMQAAGGATLDSRPQSMAAASGLSWAHSKESRASTASTAAAATTRPSEESEHEHSF